MMEISAPYPAADRVIKLPNPGLQDGLSPQNRINVRTAMTGKRYTTVQRQEGKELREFSFTLTRLKALEFYEFCSHHLKDKWGIVWDSQTLIGFVTTNPIELAMSQRAVIAGSKERVDVSFEFRTTG
jgi:hypothetical protein